MEKFFHLKENGTTVSTEILAGLTTFFAMAYIIVVNPQILSQTGMPWGGVFLATIIAAIAGTLVMGLFANVPYAQAAGMGLNAFFTYTVCFGLGFTWQQTLCMVFLCGIINIIITVTNIITVTKIRKMIIKSIPPMLQHAIGGGIGLFVAYVGMLNVDLITFTPDNIITVTKIRKMIIKSIPPMLQHAIGGGIGLFVAYVGMLNVDLITFTPDAETTAAVGATPGLATFDKPVLWVFLIGLVLAIAFTVLKVKGGLLLAIAITTVVGIPFGVTTLFSDPAKLPLVIVTIFAFSMSDTFDTIGTFIGTGRRTGIFSEDDEKSLESGHGFSSKMDKALFADSIATSIGAICGTSNTTTYVESAAGIGAGGRTGLTSVVVAACFAVSAFLSPIISAVPSAATAGVLVIVGCMMASSLSPAASSPTAS